jgi:hypothetical protein
VASVVRPVQSDPAPLTRLGDPWGLLSVAKVDASVECRILLLDRQNAGVLILLLSRRARREGEDAQERREGSRG